MFIHRPDISGLCVYHLWLITFSSRLRLEVEIQPAHTTHKRIQGRACTRWSYQLQHQLQSLPTTSSVSPDWKPAQCQFFSCQCFCRLLTFRVWNPLCTLQTNLFTEQPKLPAQFLASHWVRPQTPSPPVNMHTFRSRNNRYNKVFRSFAYFVKKRGRKIQTGVEF